MTNKKYSSSIEWLRDQVEEFLINNPEITAECFGWWAVQDTKLVGRLREGADVTTRKMDRIIAFLANPQPPKKGEVK